MSIPIPSILDRHAGLCTLQFRNDPTILGYRLRVANSLDDAYGAFNGVAGAGTTALFDVSRGRTYMSREIRRRRVGISGDITRGQTRATFDPGDFFGLSAAVPPDAAPWFLRVQVATQAAGFPGGAFPGTFSELNQSEICIVPDPQFFAVPRPALTLYGTAPNLPGTLPGRPAPAGSLVFRVPNFADAMVFTNHGTGDLLLALGRQQPLMLVEQGQILTHSSGMRDEVVVVADGGNPAFSVLLSVVAGAR